MTDQVPNASAINPTLENHDPKVACVLDQYLEDLQNGRACGRAELLEKHPEIKDALADYLSSIEMVAGLGLGDDLLTQQLGDFEIVKLIGSGAMGVVYLANQVSLKRQVALKVLRYTVVGKQATKRFQREAELVATLRHPNIVPIYTTGQQDGSHYLAMRLVDGRSLSQWSAEENVTRDAKTIAKWGAQVAGALAHAHQRGVIHRDIKPSNLLVEQDHVWLTDFGLARRFDDLRMSMTGAMLGTPNYMSPEQATPDRHPTDHRSDIYSLGATLFELLTGRCVFLAETPHAVLAQVIADEPPPLRSMVPDASRDLETILLKCLEKDPSERYQTAQQLADDLDAFVEDRLIKARRPNVIERVTRWKRNNQKAVSTAMLAASAALMLLGVSVAVWMAWKDSITGTIEIASNEGPIVGRLIDDSGNASPSFTIPTEGPLPFAAGDHTLQTWSGGRFGESQRVTLTPKTNSKLKIQLSEDGVFDERTVQGVPKVLPLGNRDDLLFFHEEGITRMDGRSGKERWTANAEKFLQVIQKESFKAMTARIEKADDPNSIEPDSPILWSIPDYLAGRDDDGDHNQQFLPIVATNFPDINEDGQQDVMIACRHQAVLFAFDGEDGTLLWHYNAGILNEQSKTIHSPMSLGDIDGDKIDDFGCQFFSFTMGNTSNPKRWIDAVSGKTGERIWQRSMPTELFDVPASTYRPSFCQMETFRGTGCYFVAIHSAGKGWKYRREPYKQKVTGELVPWAGSWVPKPKNGSSEQLLLACGSKIISCDPSTGKPGRFNEGQPLELGFIPALQPQVVQTFDKEQQTIGLLLTEIVSSVGINKGNKPITRFSMRSLDSGEELWRFDADYELEWWPHSQSNWPVIADLNGDATPEILIADGTDLESRRPTGLASLQALDARTGKPLWDTQQRAKIRSLDRQIQYALLGPDEDGDGLDDVYVVAPMAKSRCWIFVDILSGVTGKRLRTVHSEIPVFQSDDFGFSIEKPFFFDTALDRPGLVIASPAINVNYQRHSTVVMSTATGELINIGDQLEHPIAADGDGDGSDDLFLLKPRDRSKPLRSNQLVTLKSSSGGIKFAGESKLTRIDDVDGDGVRDLLDAPIGHYLTQQSPSNEQARRVVSGANGKGLSEWEYQRPAEALYPANGDFDRDGVDDFLAEQRSNDQQEAILVLVSGAKGKVLWQQPARIIGVSDATAQCHDIDGDGQSDLLLFHHFADQNLPAQFRLTCRDGKSGDEAWHFDIAPTNFITHEFHRPSYELRILDVNRDGHADILCPCFYKNSQPSSVAINGKTGKPIWKLLPLSKGSGKTAFGWQSEIIPAAQNSSSQQGNRSVFVTAWEGHGPKDEDQLNVNFVDLVSGDPVSTWTAAGEFSKPQLPYGVRSRTEKVPLVIADGDKRFAGIMLDAGKKELVVLDFSFDSAKEVRRIVSGDLILVSDIDGDGKTEGVFFNQKEFVTFELASGNEIHRKSLTWAASVRNIRTDPDSDFIRVETEDGPNRRLKLVDPATLEVQWDLNWPADTDFDGLLCGDGSDDIETARRPRVLFTETNGTSSIVATASAARFNNSGDTALTKRLRSRKLIHDLAGAPFAADTDDPRLIEPLPWNLYGNAMGLFEIEGLDRSPVVLITQLLPIVLGAIVFPGAYFYILFRRRQWNLQWFLLMPLVFVLPYVFFHIPSPLGAEYAQTSMPPWQGKLLGAIVLLPFLIFISLFVWYFLHGRWKSLFLLVIFALAVPGVMAVSELATTDLLEGTKFDWLDPGSLWLLWAGVWAGGVGIVILWPLAFITRFMLRIVQCRRTASEPTEPAVA
ncbi:Serine/threonine-protein kinase PrkC [Novipirellula aureliae]|uniref:non-specific serine/threonine protein kinase n=1 Tax=Novipirellula aureliae TaxID=2527966 RepID=A0A5C6DBM0_9BACT|nr:serine/threonine-protein kinase [Novipirellula aureliae]TWU34583.1 Serine/threonine-protein kinase PrkC [Novipirellula aureliae]